jgi:hypothetical protein
MRSSKEIEIIIQAQLEQGSALENAKSLGQGISTAIEAAFEGLGERIASNLILKMQGVLSNVKFGDILANNPQATAQLSYVAKSNTDIPGYNQASSGLLLPSGMSGFDSRLPAPPPGGAVPGSAAPVDPATATRPAAAAGTPIHQGGGYKSPYNDYFLRSHFGVGYLERDPAGSFKSMAEEMRPTQLAQLDQTREDLRNFKRLKKIDPEAQMDPDLAERVQRDTLTARRLLGGDQKELSTLASEIPNLTRAIQDLAHEIESYEAIQAKPSPTPQEKEVLQKGVPVLVSETKDGVTTEKIVPQTLEQAKAALGDLTAQRSEKNTRYAKVTQTADEATDFIKDADAQVATGKTPWYKNRKLRAGALIGGIGLNALGEGLEFAGKYDLIQARSAAGTARLENNEYTSLLTGDLEDAMTTELTGGQKEEIERARSNARKRAGGKMLGGLAWLGTAAASGAATVAEGATVLGLPAAAMQSVVTAAAAAKGVSTLTSGYEEWMGIDDMAANMAEQMRNATKQQQRIPFLAARASGQRAVMSYSTAQAMGDENMSGAIYGASPDKSSFNYGEKSLRYRAASEFGLSGQQFDTTNQQMIYSMGGGNPFAQTLEEQRPMEFSKGIYNAYSQLLRQQGAGFYNAAKTATTFYGTNYTTGNQVEDREKAIQDASGLYSSLRNSGVETKSVPELIDVMADRISSRGMGSQYFEEGNLKDSIAMAQQIFGKDNMSGQNVKSVQKMYNNINDLSRNDDGWSAFASQGAVNRLNEKYNLNIGEVDSIELRNFVASPASFKEWYNKKNKGREIDDAEAEKIVKDEKAFRNQEYLSVARSAMGSAADTHVAKQMGIQTLDEFNQFIKTSDQVSKGITDIEDVTKNFPGPLAPGKMPIGKEHKKQIEAGEAELVSKGFESLEEMTGKLVGKFQELHDVMDNLAKFKNQPAAASEGQKPMFGGNVNWDHVGLAADNSGPFSPEYRDHLKRLQNQSAYRTSWGRSGY